MSVVLGVLLIALFYLMLRLSQYHVYSYYVSMYETMSISTGLYPKLDLWNKNKLKLQLQILHECTDNLKPFARAQRLCQMFVSKSV